MCLRHEEYLHCYRNKKYLESLREKQQAFERAMKRSEEKRIENMQKRWKQVTCKVNQVTNSCLLEKKNVVSSMEKVPKERPLSPIPNPMSPLTRAQVSCRTMDVI